MSKDELFEQLPETLKDELHDVIKYVEMSKATDDDGYSQIFRDIAHEEHQHAHHIKDIILDKNLVLPDKNEIDTLFEEAHKALKEI